MAVQRSVRVRNAMLDAQENITGGSPLLQLRAGAPPANCAAPATGALLAQFVGPADYAGNAVNGVKTWATFAAVTALASGTVGHYRICTSDGTICDEQGTVGLAASSPDAVIDSVGITAGQQVTLSSWAVTMPGG